MADPRTVFNFKLAHFLRKSTGSPCVLATALHPVVEGSDEVQEVEYSRTTSYGFSTCPEELGHDEMKVYFPVGQTVRNP